MSHMTSFVKALNAWLKVRVLVKTAAVTDRKAQAPTGSGSNTSPAQQHTFTLVIAEILISTTVDCYDCYFSSAIVMVMYQCLTCKSTGFSSMQIHSKAFNAQALYSQNLGEVYLLVMLKDNVGRLYLPVMVDTKMERSVHACTVIPFGMGTRNLRAAPTAMDRSSGTGLAPCTRKH